MLASVGIVRFMKSCEAMATRGSVWIWASGTWRWRVTKKVMRACMVWSALGALFVHGLQSLCWKNEVGVSIDDRRQSAQYFARMSGRVTGGGWKEVGLWCTSRCRLACKAHGADVGVFAVFEPAVAVWGCGAADVACLGGGGLGLGGCVCSFRGCSAFFA